MNETMTLRYFGRCSTKGCKHRRVIDETSHPRLKRFTTDRNDTLAILDDKGNDWPIYDIGDYREWAAAMRAANFVCPEHNRIVTFTGGRFTYNETKACDGRCMAATGPTCDCSCGGSNHGSKYL